MNPWWLALIVPASMAAGAALAVVAVAMTRLETREQTANTHSTNLREDFDNVADDVRTMLRHFEGRAPRGTFIAKCECGLLIGDPSSNGWRQLVGGYWSCPRGHVAAPIATVS